MSINSSAWGPLAYPVFRALWLAALVSNIGTLMQNVAAAWLMTSLTTSPVPVALLTTMANLPLFLVGLPAGALADIVDRRWIVLLTQFWMLAVAVLLGGIAVVGHMTPGLLLGLTFLISLGGALSAPAWQAIVPELVPRNQLASAVALNGAGFNLARAVGPAIGGLLVAGSGSAAVFLLNAVSFLGIIFVIARWHPEPRAAVVMPERVGGAVAAGLRFARFAPQLHAVLVRTAAYIFAASALWALLPVVATQQLGLGALGYGVMLGSIGFGAVAGAAIMPWLRERFSVNQLTILVTLGFAVGLCVLAWSSNLIVLNALLLVVGFGWLTMNSLLNVAAQTTVPSWVQARALGVYLLVSQGGLAGGSALWGVVAEQLGVSEALLLAAGMLIIGLATAWRWPLKTGESIDLRPAQHWPEPVLANEPGPEDGPVLVTVEYHVAEEQQPAFFAAMADVQRIRQRDGATRWELFRDTADGERVIESFVVPTWAEHMRQHARVTMADRDVEEQAQAFQRPGTTPIVAHLIAAPRSQALRAILDRAHGDDATQQ